LQAVKQWLLKIKCIFIIGFFLLVELPLTAQTERILSPDSTWKSLGIITLNVGQTSFTNWAAGGDNQLNLNSISHFRLRYNKGKRSWENLIELKFGSLIFDNFVTKKTDDILNFASKFGFKASPKWNYSYYLSFNSQLARGYNYPNDSVPVSMFMAPGYFIAGLGFDYLPNSSLSFLFSPITNKLTIVNDPRLADLGSYGIEKPSYNSAGQIISPSNKFKNEPGAFIKANYQQEFKNGLTLSSKVELFSAFSQKPLKLDINWSSFVSYKISRIVRATFSLDLIYDEDISILVDTNGDGLKENVGPRLQAKQSLGLGLALVL
jgi:hypothetical protein